jgi:hypothetical protein
VRFVNSVPPAAYLTIVVFFADGDYIRSKDRSESDECADSFCASSELLCEILKPINRAPPILKSVVIAPADCPVLTSA